MKRTLLTLLLIIIATMWTNTANALSLKIDDTEIDLSTSKDLTGDWLEAGKVHWDADTKTLTLDNATLVSKVKPNNFIWIVDDEITIKLVGSNSISNEGIIAIYLRDCKLTINGGSLKTKSKWIDIYSFSQSTVTIDGCEVETNVMGNNNGPSFNNHLVVKNATLKVKKIWYMTTITLIDCHIQSPEGGKVIDKEIYGSMGQMIVDSNGEESINIVIVPNSTALREAYVVEDGATLTFYYDANKAARTGTVYDIDQKQASDNSIPAWAGTFKESKSSITSVIFDSSFKDYKPTSTRNWFYKCDNLKNIEGISNLNTENVTNMNRMFANCKSLTTLKLSNFNTAKVTDMSKMFSGCYALTTLDLSNFNTENVTEMSSMFYNCKALTTLDLTKFNTANVTEMSDMFSGCKTLTSLDLSKFNTGKVTGMNGMFWNCSALITLDLKSFNTEKVTDMYGMFWKCSALITLDLKSFNTEKVTNMSYMFYGCSALTTLDLTNFNTEKVTDMSYMFQDCENLTTIYCDDTWTCSQSSGMFSGCTKLKGAVAYDKNKTGASMANPTTGYFTTIGEITPVAYVVEYDGTLTFYYDTEKNTRIGYIYDINKKKDASVPIWAGKDIITKVVFDKLFKDYRPTTTASWFYSCKNLETVEGIEYLNTEEVTDMSRMFAVCNALNALDVSKFNTAKVTNMSGMFTESALTTLDLTSFNTAKVTNMSGMFAGSALTTLDLTSFNTANVTDMSEMFAFCDKLTSVDLSKFNTAKVTNMMSMFWACEALTTIYCDDDWTKGVVTESENMFADCTKLKGAVPFDATKTDVTMANPTTGYFTKKGGTSIETPAADVPAARRGIYTLNGVRLNTSLDRLPAGIYIVGGKKVVKK